MLREYISPRRETVAGSANDTRLLQIVLLQSRACRFERSIWWNRSDQQSFVSLLSLTRERNLLNKDRSTLSKLDSWHCPKLREIAFEGLWIDDSCETQHAILYLTVVVMSLVILARLTFKIGVLRGMWDVSSLLLWHWVGCTRLKLSPHEHIAVPDPFSGRSPYTAQGFKTANASGRVFSSQALPEYVSTSPSRYVQSSLPFPGQICTISGNLDWPQRAHIHFEALITCMRGFRETRSKHSMTSAR